MTNKTLAYCPGTGFISPFNKVFTNSPPQNCIEDSDLSKAAALILWGGEDISPSLYGQKVSRSQATDTPSKRDLFEWEMMRQAVKHKVPIIGVCRGAQIATAFAGGSLVQHVSNHSNGNHEIETFDGQTMYTNSIHHQMMNPYDMDEKDYQLIAWSKAPQSRVYCGEDNGTEIFLKNGKAFSTMKEPEIVFYPQIRALCIQGHPEWLGPEHSLVFYFNNLIKQLFLE